MEEKLQQGGLSAKTKGLGNLQTMTLGFITLQAVFEGEVSVSVPHILVYQY